MRLRNIVKKKQNKQILPKSRKRVLVEWGAQIVLLLVAVVGISAWQSRNMVGTGELAPALALTDLSGNSVTLSNDSGKKVVLYFFAPWCSVCHAASSNVNALRQAYGKEELAIYAVGLGWETALELRQFARKHGLLVPVLIGTDETATDFRISSFPSIYILDEQHRIASSLIGYTTELGLRIRTALTGLL
jgi:peroxiredoxin